MKVSASSFETVRDRCTRQWWFKELRDMPEGKVIAGSDFGTAIHGVNERWRLADDLGNGPDLYPEGWNNGLDEADSVLVKMLHEKAVEQGILVRRKGRKPEEWMNTPIIVGDDVVQLTGKLDCEDLEGFEDDKSTKSAKWAKDEEGLAADSAMMFYAVEWCRRHADAVKCRMRYNYFLKDPASPKVWPVEAIVTREVVEHFKQNDLLPTVREMAEVAAQDFTDEQWEQVEGAKTQDACRAFGGCPFATICGRVEQPAQYRARVARILSNRNKEKPVGIFSKKGVTAPAPSAPTPSTPAPSAPAAPAKAGGIFARKNSTPAAVVAEPAKVAEPAPAPQEAPAAPPVAPAPTPSQESTVEAMPWAHPNCRACKGTGIHPTERRPCKGCRSTRMVQKMPTDEAFDITWNDDGTISWSEKGHEGQPGSAGTAQVIPAVATPAQAPTPTVETPVEKPKRAPRGKKAQEVAEDVQDSPAAPKVDQATEALQQEAAKAGLPMILLCGAFPEKLPAYYRVAPMADVFAEAAQLVADATGKDFWSINAFERRDALCKMAPDLAERLKSMVIVCPRSGPDQTALVDALKPYAGIVLAGLN